MMFDARRHRAWLGMQSEDRWEHTVLGMLDDLELQAEGLHLAERAAEVDELSTAQYAEVELVARLHASIGAAVRVDLLGGPQLHGRLARVGSDWLLVDDGRGTGWFASLDQVAMIDGLADRSMPDEARPLAARLSLRAVLRRLVDERAGCRFQLRGGRAVHGVPARVGADFVEIRQDDVVGALTVPLTAIAAVQASGAGS